jgi:hypothetical protein
MQYKLTQTTVGITLTMIKIVDRIAQNLLPQITILLDKTLPTINPVIAADEMIVLFNLVSAVDQFNFAAITSFTELFPESTKPHWAVINIK